MKRIVFKEKIPDGFVVVFEPEDERSFETVMEICKQCGWTIAHNQTFGCIGEYNYPGYGTAKCIHKYRHNEQCVDTDVIGYGTAIGKYSTFSMELVNGCVFTAEEFIERFSEIDLESSLKEMFGVI